jgi:hypothetical protein
MIRKGNRVRWTWGTGTAEGKVMDICDHTLNKTIKGSTVSLHGTPGDKALLIKQNKGGEVLKLESEVEKL